MFQSILQQRGQVPFPEFRGDRAYMVPFTKRDGLPDRLHRWQPTVDAMLEGIDAPGVIYIMVDEKVVVPGQSHRRPGVHIDGYWRQMPGGEYRHSGGHVGAAGMDWDHDQGRWSHVCFDHPEALVLVGCWVGWHARGLRERARRKPHEAPK